MQNKSLWNIFLRYITLNIIGMLGISCYILADTFFVSRGLGANGLTALNLAIPVYSFIHGCGLMLGMGGAAKYSVFKSQQRKQQANAVFTATMLSAILISFLCVLVGFGLSSTLTELLGANEDVFSMTQTYVKVILLFAPAFIINDVMICFVRNDGNPKLSMFAMLMGSFINILLDYIFVFPLQMGIFGAVFATGISPIVSLLLLSKHRSKKQNGFHFTKIKNQVHFMYKILIPGFPSFVSEVASGIVIIVFNIVIVQLSGNTGVAAYGIIANLSLVVIAVFTGIAQGIQPLLSHAYGAGNKKAMHTIMRYAFTTLCVLSFVIYSAIYLFADPITAIFNIDQNVTLQTIATTGMKLYFLGIIVAGFNIIVSIFFTSSENSIPAYIISLLRGLLLILPMTFLLSSLFQMRGVWLAFPATECIVAMLGIYTYVKACKKGIRV